jgi:hypothetical protein
MQAVGAAVVAMVTVAAAGNESTSAAFPASCEGAQCKQMLTCGSWIAIQEGWGCETNNDGIARSGYDEGVASLAECQAQCKVFPSPKSL